MRRAFLVLEVTAAMTDIAIMIEGQNGLTWPRWQRIARTVEDAGFAVSIEPEQVDVRCHACFRCGRPRVVQRE